MASSNVIFFILVLLAISTGCHGDHVPLFVFGDSYFDAGNNNYIDTIANFRSNIWPYGETYFKYPTGRVSDGRIIPDFIAQYAKLPLITPYLQPGNHQFTNGVNFASCGAGALIETWPGVVINLTTQLSYFKNVQKQLKEQLGDKEAKTFLSKVVNLFSIGSNDYLTLFLSNSSVFQKYSHVEYVEIVIGNITTVIKEMYKGGARNFGFLNLAPWGCVPVLKALKPESTSHHCVEDMNTIVNLHNEALSNALRNLGSQLEGFMYSYFDFYSAIKERLDNPSNYGFKEVESSCCGWGPYRGVDSCGGKRDVKEYRLCANPSEYLFFDSAHTTQEANSQIAKLVWSGTINISWPYNLKQLFQRGQQH